MYFDTLPTITYDGRTIRDISIDFIIDKTVKSDATIYDNYVVQDGEHIEDVAFDKYGDPEYHWIIMLANDIVDPFFDWALSSRELNAYIDLNYSAPDSIRHYILGNLIVPVNSGGSPVTYRLYEENLNDEKRKIKLIRKEYISMMADNLASLASQ
ncbi:MAG: baseplate wedge protein 53 [Ghiorsea sp.]